MTLHWIKRCLGSARRDMGKFKFRAIFRGFYDRQYREEIKKLVALTVGKEFKLKEVRVRLSDIKGSHSINYPIWVTKLSVDFLVDPKSRTKDPMKILRTGDHYTVIDGNHRLAAFNTVLGPNDFVLAHELVEIVKEDIVDDYCQRS